MDIGTNNIAIRVTGASVIIIAGMLFLKDNIQKTTLKQTAEIEHSPYQSKIVAIEKAKKTALAAALVVKTSLGDSQKETQISNAKTSLQDLSSQPHVILQPPKTDPIATETIAQQNTIQQPIDDIVPAQKQPLQQSKISVPKEGQTQRIAIENVKEDKPTNIIDTLPNITSAVQKIAVLKLEEATSIASREKFQSTESAKKAASELITSKAITTPPIITTLKLEESTSVTAIKALQQIWVIQLGSFSNVKNAANLRDKLKKAGFASFIEAKNVNNKKTTRVYVGPKNTHQNAKEIWQQLKDRQHIKGIIVAYDK